MPLSQNSWKSWIEANYATIPFIARHRVLPKYFLQINCILTSVLMSVATVSKNITRCIIHETKTFEWMYGVLERQYKTTHSKDTKDHTNSYIYFGCERLDENYSLGTFLPKQCWGAASRLCEITFHRTTKSFIRVFSSIWLHTTANVTMSVSISSKNNTVYIVQMTWCIF